MASSCFCPPNPAFSVSTSAHSHRKATLRHFAVRLPSRCRLESNAPNRLKVFASSSAVPVMDQSPQSKASSHVPTVVEVDLGNRSYPIYIGSGLLNQPQLLQRHIHGKKVLIVTNTTVAPLYLDKTISALTDGNPNVSVETVILPDGEKFKNMETLMKVFDKAIESRLDRRCTFVALGGGVIGDMCGYAAASYLRGVNFIQIPTTVMAQVDSSVGGKTGINHPLGKNMIGAFYQPQCVLVDTDTLNTLPDRELASGLAEVIKYGLIRDAEFFEWQENNMSALLARDPEAFAYAIKRSCENKAEVVSLDEKESGLRATLNLGHTFGHVMAVDMSRRLGWIDDSLVHRVDKILQQTKLPTTPPKTMTVEMFKSIMAVDKKVADGKLRLILLKGPLGNCVFTGVLPAVLLALPLFPDTTWSSSSANPGLCASILRTATATAHYPRSTSSSIYNLQMLSSQNEGNPSTTAHSANKNLQEELRKLRILLQQNRSDSAKSYIANLAQSNSVSELYCSFCAPVPSPMKPLFVDMLFSVYVDSKLLDKASELYSLMRKDGKFPTLSGIKVFLEMLNSSRQYRKALEVFSDAVNANMQIDSNCYSIAIQSAVKLGDLRRALQLMDFMRKSGLRMDAFVYNVVMGGLCKERRVSEARKLFDEMLERRVTPTKVTFNILIDGYCKVGNLEEAFNVREKMRNENVKPNEITFNTLLSGLCKMGRMEEVNKVLEEMKTCGFVPDGFTSSILFDGHLRCADIDSSMALFEEVVKKGNGKMDIAEQILNKLMQNGYSPTEVIFSIIVNGYCKEGNMEKDGRLLEAEVIVNDMIDAGESNKCLEWYEQMKTSGVRPTLRTYHPLISACKKEECGLTLVERIVQEMYQMNLSPDRVVYNELIYCYALHGEVGKSFALRNKMEEQGIHADKMTYNSLILGHLKKGECQEARDLVDTMKARGIVPNSNTYNTLISGHCKLKDFDGAYIWYREMFENGFLPVISICTELISGLKAEGKSKEAQTICSEMSAKGLDEWSSNEDFSVVSEA
nr:3-dehydroquinate synthase, chloroplastic [Ipomoea batatas]